MTVGFYATDDSISMVTGFLSSRYGFTIVGNDSEARGRIAR